MMQSKYQGRFGGSRRLRSLGEDVNPSAYIVNLADCMLVLACGFMVAMMAAWGINLSSTSTVTDSDMQKIEAEVAPEDLENAGSDFVPAGTVYYNPATNSYYILRDDYQIDEELSEEVSSLDEVSTEELLIELSTESADVQESSSDTSDTTQGG